MIINEKSLFVFMLVVLMSKSSLISGQMVGSPKQMNLTDPEVNELVQRLSKFALTKLAEKRMMTSSSSQANQPLTYSLVKVISARSQIVSGINYHLTLQFRDTSDCNKSRRRSISATSQQCGSNSPIEQCNVTIWEQRWMNRTELTKTECSKVIKASVGGSTSGGLMGGRQRISNKDPEALKALDFAVAKFNQDAVNERAYFKPAQIFNTYKQIVSGVKYTYMIKLAPTNCEKHENLSILKTDDCVFVGNQQTSSTTTTSTKRIISGVNSGGSDTDPMSIEVSIDNNNDQQQSVPKSRNCKINVHDQPWIPNPQQRYKVTEVNCF